MTRKYVRKEKKSVGIESVNLEQDNTNSVIPIEHQVTTEAIPSDLFDVSIKQTVNVVGTVEKQNKGLGKIILLQDVAGMKSGALINVVDIDESNNVYFKIGNIQTFFTTAEKGRLWDFNERA